MQQEDIIILEACSAKWFLRDWALLHQRAVWRSVRLFRQVPLNIFLWSNASLQCRLSSRGHTQASEHILAACVIIIEGREDIEYIFRYFLKKRLNSAVQQEEICSAKHNCAVNNWRMGEKLGMHLCMGSRFHWAALTNITLIRRLFCLVVNTIVCVKSVAARELREFMRWKVRDGSARLFIWLRGARRCWD